MAENVRRWSEGQLEADALEIDRILRKRSRRSDEIKRLLYMFHWYCHVSGSSYRSIPVELMRYIASELKKYADNSKYRPFPAQQGRPGVADWDTIDSGVKLLLEFDNLDHPNEKVDLRELFWRVIEDQGPDTFTTLDPDTLEKHIQLFISDHPRSTAVDWDAIDSEVKLLLEADNSEHPDEKADLREVFQLVIGQLKADPYRQLDADTVENHIKLFASNHPDLV